MPLRPHHPRTIPPARWPVIIAFGLGAAFGVLVGSGTAQPAETCDLALSLVFDVSTSMDDDEYKQMRDGVAASLLDDAIWQDAGGTMIQVVAFADRPEVMIPWTPATQRGDVATRLSRMAKPRIGSNTGTGLAIAFVGSQMLPCARMVIDIAGDGESNHGPTPESARAGIDPAIEINALATTEAAAVFYQNRVIQGPRAFVQPASGFEEFEKAMKDKLTQELYLG